MSSMPNLDALIDDLVDNAAPVRPQSATGGRLALLAVALASLAALALLMGLREDVMRLAPGTEVALAGGLMALLALAAGTTAVRMARPQVGAPSSGAPWALAALLLLPAVALAGIAAQPAGLAILSASLGTRCLFVGLASGTATIGFLGWWLRRGAPVRPESAGWLSGLAGGAVGALAVTLECPFDGLAHIGIWHVAAVPLAGFVGRVLLPPLIRW